MKGKKIARISQVKKRNKKTKRFVFLNVIAANFLRLFEKKNDKKAAPFIFWRFGLVYVAIFLALATLLIKMGQLQFLEKEMLVHQGDSRSIRTQEILTIRGMVTDRSARPLAVSVPVKAIWVDPKVALQKEVSADNRRWQELADVLGINLSETLAKINNNPSGRFLYLARQVPEAEADYVEKLKITGVYLKNETRRFYPAGERTAQLIGITNIDGDGIEGIEKGFNDALTGKSGERTFRKDRQGRVIEDISTVDREDPSNITLSIDERLQSIAYRELDKAVKFNKADSGTAVLIDIKTGEILAMVNSPSYNPNNRIGVSQSHLRNRAVTDVFEPGSTIKPLVVMTALRKKVTKPDEVIDTRPFILNHHEIKDVGYYPKLSITGILEKSSNVGVSRLAMRMTPQDLLKTYSDFGFGQMNNIGLVGENSGTLPFEKKRWSDLERATFSFGYGQMITPLQLAHAYATIGDYGEFKPLSILKVNKIPQGKQIMPKEITKTVLHMMESVALRGGGGTKAAIPGYRVAVKTGTAKKVGPQGKYIDEYIAYVAGIAPVTDPKFALVVVINNPKAGQYYGGAVSAPVFSAIMSSVLRTMNIQPDNLADMKDSQVVINP